MKKFRCLRGDFLTHTVDILCILVCEQSVCQMVPRMLTPELRTAQVSEELLERPRYRRDPTKI